MARPTAAAAVAERRAPRPFVRVLVTLGAGLAGLVAVEVAMRVLDLGPPPAFEREGDLFQPSRNAAIRFENRPGAEQRLIYRQRGGKPPEIVEMRVNAQGFRGAEVTRAKPAGVKRIACVGDSHTFGWGVAEGATWPDHLRAELERSHPAERFEVLNCGVNNHDTVQEVAWLEERVLAFEPDLVVLQFYVNDAAVHGAERSAPRAPDRILRWTDPARDGWLTRLRSVSRLAELVADGVYRRHGLSVYSAQRTQLFAEEEPGWHMVRDALRRARDLLAARERPFVVALYPEKS
jgi:lysophospholipase L1-like esterase